MSQEFPTASMDITKDFHILHSAYTVLTYTLVISSSKQKYTTDSLTHTHTHTHTQNGSNNNKQKATGHITSLANGHVTGSDAPFVCEIPTASSDKIEIFFKSYHFLTKKKKIFSCPFSIGPIFVREPSWEYSANLVGS